MKKQTTSTTKRIKKPIRLKFTVVVEDLQDYIDKISDAAIQLIYESCQDMYIQAVPYEDWDPYIMMYENVELTEKNYESVAAMYGIKLNELCAEMLDLDWGVMHAIIKCFALAAEHNNYSDRPRDLIRIGVILLGKKLSGEVYGVQRISQLNKTSNEKEG